MSIIDEEQEGEKENSLLNITISLQPEINQNPEIIVSIKEEKSSPN